MTKWGSCAVLVAACFLTPPAWAGPPDAAKVRLAGDEFEAGARAYKQKDFETAASHFESADQAVPSPQALRLAMRARSEAGQGSRAATHAAQALERYPDDAELAKLAHDILDRTSAVLHRVNVSCASPCVLAVGTRAIVGPATTRWVVYLDPGSATLSASFFGDAKGVQQTLEARAGGQSEVRFEPADDSNPAPKTPDFTPPPPPPSTVGPSPASPPPDRPVEPRSGLHPAFFVGGLVATAGLGGVTIWSGIDTKNNPGPDKVRAECAGKGTSCPAYKDGLAKETRTNVLLGATIGASVLTGVVGLFLTDWGGDRTAGTTGGAPPSSSSGSATFRGRPGATVTPEGATLSYSAVF